MQRVGEEWAKLGRRPNVEIEIIEHPHNFIDIKTASTTNPRILIKVPSTQAKQFDL